MPSVFLFSPFLTQFKPPLVIPLFLLTGVVFSLELILLELKLERLLRFGSDAGVFPKLFSDFALQPAWDCASVWVLCPVLPAG